MPDGVGSLSNGGQEPPGGCPGRRLFCSLHVCCQGSPVEDLGKIPPEADDPPGAQKGSESGGRELETPEAPPSAKLRPFALWRTWRPRSLALRRRARARGTRAQRLITDVQRGREGERGRSTSWVYDITSLSLRTRM